MSIPITRHPFDGTSMFALALTMTHAGSPLSLDAPFHHVAAVLRVTSPEQLDIPSVHRSAKAYIVAMFPSGPAPFVHPDHLEEALALTVRYDIPSVSLLPMYTSLRWATPANRRVGFTLCN